MPAGSGRPLCAGRPSCKRRGERAGEFTRTGGWAPAPLLKSFFDECAQIGLVFIVEFDQDVRPLLVKSDQPGDDEQLRTLPEFAQVGHKGLHREIACAASILMLLPS